MFTESDDIHVGKEAKRQMQLDPEQACELVKRHMGEPDWRLAAHGAEWSALEVSAHVLKALYEEAELQARERLRGSSSPFPATSGLPSGRRRWPPARSPARRSSTSSTSRPRDDVLWLRPGRRHR